MAMQQYYPSRESSSRSLSPDSSMSPQPPQPSRPTRKRRPAPKPPSQPPAPKTEANNTLISHSRTSSDSSGYHEASVLSESPDSNNSLPDSLPRRSKLPGRDGEMSRSLGDLSGPPKALKPAQSTSALFQGRKKKPAPAPPVQKMSSVAEETKTVTDGSAEVGKEKPKETERTEEKSGSPLGSFAEGMGRPGYVATLLPLFSRPTVPPVFQSYSVQALIHPPPPSFASSDPSEPAKSGITPVREMHTVTYRLTSPDRRPDVHESVFVNCRVSSPPVASLRPVRDLVSPVDERRKVFEEELMKVFAGTGEVTLDEDKGYDPRELSCIDRILPDLEPESVRDEVTNNKNAFDDFNAECFSDEDSVLDGETTGSVINYSDNIYYSKEVGGPSRKVLADEDEARMKEVANIDDSFRFLTEGKYRQEQSTAQTPENLEDDKMLEMSTEKITVVNYLYRPDTPDTLLAEGVSFETLGRLEGVRDLSGENYVRAAIDSECFTNEIDHFELPVGGSNIRNTEPTHEITDDFKLPTGEITNDFREQNYELTDLRQPSNEITDFREPSNEIADMKGPTNEITNDLKGPTNEITDDLKQPTNEITDDLKQPTNEITNDLKQPANEITNDLKQTTNELRQPTIEITNNFKHSSEETTKFFKQADGLNNNDHCVKQPSVKHDNDQCFWQLNTGTSSIQSTSQNINDRCLKEDANKGQPLEYVSCIGENNSVEPLKNITNKSSVKNVVVSPKKPVEEEIRVGIIKKTLDINLGECSKTRNQHKSVSFEGDYRLLRENMNDLILREPKAYPPLGVRYSRSEIEFMLEGDEFCRCSSPDVEIFRAPPSLKAARSVSFYGQGVDLFSPPPSQLLINRHESKQSWDHFVSKLNHILANSPEAHL